MVSINTPGDGQESDFVWVPRKQAGAEASDAAEASKTGNKLLDRFRRLSKEPPQAEGSSKTGRLMQRVQEFPWLGKKTPNTWETAETLPLVDTGKVDETSKPAMVEKAPQTGESSKAAEAWTPRVVPEMPTIREIEEAAESGYASDTGELSHTAQYVLGSLRAEQRLLLSIGGTLSGSGMASPSPSGTATAAGPSGTISEFPSVPTTDIGEGSSAARTRSPTVESVTDSEEEGERKVPELA